MLEPAELALDAATALVELRAALRVARDQRVQAVGLDPAGLGLALARGAAPLGGLPLVVGPGERPLSVIAARRLVVAPHDGWRLAQRRDGADVPIHAAVVDRTVVVPLVHDRDARREAALACRVDEA